MTGQTPKPKAGWLIEWEGGSDPCESPAAGEKSIRGKIRDGDDFERGQFSILRDGHGADGRVEVWQKGTVIGVSRDGLPVGHARRVGPGEFSAFVYCVPAPFDWFGGVHESVEAVVDFIGEKGETPDYMRERAVR